MRHASQRILIFQYVTNKEKAKQYRNYSLAYFGHMCEQLMSVLISLSSPLAAWPTPRRTRGTSSTRRRTTGTPSSGTRRQSVSIEKKILQFLTWICCSPSFGISPSSANDVAAFSSVRSVFWPRSNQIIPIGRSNERSASESELAAPSLLLSRSLPRSKRTFYRVIVTAAFIHRRKQQQQCGVHYVTAAWAQRDGLTLFSAPLPVAKFRP